MSRKGKVKARELSPDYKYNSQMVTKLINYIMRKGKKEVARGIVYKAFENVEKKLEKNPLEVFEAALDNVRPFMQVRSKRVGGATYSIPMPVSSVKSTALALKWIVLGVKEKVLKNAVLDLTQVLVDSYNKTGFAVGKRNEMHRQADANKAFSHYGSAKNG